MLLQACSTTTFLSFVSFAVLYLAAAFYTSRISSYDPTSIFFNPRHAYTPWYSAVRQREAEAFVSEAEKHFMDPRVESVNVGNHKKLCIGIPSIARAGVLYVRTAVGSVLDGLTIEERGNIHLIVFIPHTDPTVHPVYHEHWLYNLTDKVLLYDLPDDNMKHIVELENDAGLFREKGLFDYTYLLRACYATEAPYIAVFEDDIVALDGWYHRTLTGLEQAETKSALQQASPDCKSALYILQAPATAYFSIIVLYLRLLYRRVSRLEQRRLEILPVLVAAFSQRTDCNSRHSSVRFPEDQKSTQHSSDASYMLFLSAFADTSIFRCR